MTMAILKLDGLTCPSCMQKIEHAVAGVDGVQAVKVLFNAAKLKAKFDPHVTSADALSTVVSKLGYTVVGSKVKELA
ncbi:heavy-metal-associated domain-containing protein [Lacticaseibacillus thailandensis]|nr:heavy-metal-associated domain-containing protein [Lacticaseibacillus thailandensis]